MLRPVARRAQVTEAVTGPLLAQADRAARRAVQTLPDTASPLPLFALAGSLSLLGGLGLTLRRRLFART